MGNRKWFTEGSARVVETDCYRYKIEWAVHEQYGRCFRVSKFLRADVAKLPGDYYIGHFVLVPDDLCVFDAMTDVFHAGKAP